jgi:hypothetical protein
MKEILLDGVARGRMLEGLAKVKSRLRAPARGAEEPEQSPAERAAAIILSIANRSLAEQSLAERSLANRP